MSEHHEVLIVGGGTAGITVAAKLLGTGRPPTVAGRGGEARPDTPEVAILEPSDAHDYQPLWTLVGGGVCSREQSRRPMRDYIPRGATWLQDAATGFDPANRRVTTRDGRTIGYDQLVVATGLKLLWDRVEGLAGNVGKDGICSNYAWETVESTWRELQAFRGGTALFTHPATPVKCGGAPQKVMYLAEEHFRRAGVRDRAKVIFCKGGKGIFDVPKYAAALDRICAERGIERRFQLNLKAVRPASREAVFQDLDGGPDVALRYDLLHVTPPMGPPDVLARSPLAGAGGWVEVDKHTLQHVRFPEVFALGDCSDLPTSKTGAAIRKQAPTVAANLLALRAGRALPASYDGYTACPIVTGYGKLIMAEFDYDKRPQESFPFDQAKERYSMYALKAYALPQLYWNAMLRGRM